LREILDMAETILIDIVKEFGLPDISLNLSINLLPDLLNLIP
jgi:hypothetical protein